MSLKKLWQYLKILKMLREVKRSMAEVKSGKKTSEFIVLIGNLVVALAGVLAGQIPASTAAIILGVLSGIYVAGRSIVKLTATKTDDIVIEKIGEIIKKLGGKVDSE